MTDRLPVVLRTDVTPSRLQEMPAGDLLSVSVLANAIAVALTGLVTTDSTDIAVTDTILQAAGKLQAQMNLRAELESPTFTGAPKTPTAPVSTNNTEIASTAFVHDAIGGVVTKNSTGGTVVLTDVDVCNAIIKVAGALTSNLVLQFPTTFQRSWIIENATTGSYSVTAKHSSGSGVVVTQGRDFSVFSDGTNILQADSFTTLAATTSNDQAATTAFAQAAIKLAAQRGAVNTNALWTVPGTYSWTSPNVDTYVWAIVRGGGGAGGAAGLAYGSGGGGGAGGLGYGVYKIPANTTITITVGLGGNAPANNSSSSGFGGGASSFGSYLSCAGGQGGVTFTAGSAGGSPGTVSGNNIGPPVLAYGGSGTHCSATSSGQGWAGGHGGGESGGVGGTLYQAANPNAFRGADGRYGCGGGGGGWAQEGPSRVGAGGAGYVSLMWNAYV